MKAKDLGPMAPIVQRSKLSINVEMKYVSTWNYLGGIKLSLWNTKFLVQ